MRVRVISKDGIGYNTRIETEDGTPIDYAKSITLHCRAEGIWTGKMEIVLPKIDVFANIEKHKVSYIPKNISSIKRQKTRRELKRHRDYKYLQIMW